MTDAPDEDRPDQAPTGHDTVAAIMGLIAAGLFVASPQLVDTSGPDPFYKGPLIFPMIALGLIAGASVPAIVRIVRGPRGRLFHLDGVGFPVRGAALFVLACGFPLAIGAVGVLAATAALAALGLLVVGRPLREVVITALLLPLSIEGVFVVLLDIWFPEPWLLDLRP